MPDEPPARPLRVLVADDQMPFRIAVRRLLDRAADLEIVAEAADGDEAIRLVEEHRPDVVLLDVRMPGTDGPTAARTIARRWPEISVVLCSSHGREDVPDDLVAPYVPKELLSADVLRAAAGRS
jgi:DNA-binding NarL/FixJ family response regulator